MPLLPEREVFYGLTTSVFSAAIGLNKYTSRNKLYKRLIGEDSFKGNVATEYGHEYEPHAVSWYESENGVILDNTGKNQKFYTRHDFGSTPDGIDTGAEALVEIKCPYSQKIYEEDYWVPMYMPQLQGQMEVVGMDCSRFVVWTPTEQALWNVEYSRKYWNWMRPLLDEFWEGVINRKPPKRRKRPVPPKIEIKRIL